MAEQQYKQRQQQPLLIETERAQKQHNIVIFDWDDTLFPTTAIFKQKNNGNQQENVSAADLKTLSENILNLLNEYCSIYEAENIYILTNGEQHWILQSLQYIINYCLQNKIKNSFTSIHALLTNGKITLISANYLYSKQFPKQTMMWKYLAFYQIVDAKFLINYNDNNQYTLISIGDSMDEWNASQYIVCDTKNRYNMNITLHRMKLTEKPSINKINEQFNLIKSLRSVFKQKLNDTEIDYVAEEATFSRCVGIK